MDVRCDKKLVPVPAIDFDIAVGDQSDYNHNKLGEENSLQNIRNAERKTE